jgi:dihydroxy-acid dehydratase
MREGDSISIDVDAGTIDVEVAPEEIRQRLAAWTPPAPRYTSGVFAKYCALVASASEGAVTAAK